jgi:hypothetical protein
MAANGLSGRCDLQITTIHSGSTVFMSIDILGQSTPNQSRNRLTNTGKLRFDIEA